jgi:hypothetical protein
VDRRKSLLVNIGEVATDAALREAAERNSVRIFPKVRVADALEISRSGLSDEEYGYALRAHFDFVIADPENGRAHFAVEFDEPHHDTDEATSARDTMKDSISERLGLPVIRIDADFLRTVGQFTLVGWLVDLWFLHEWFIEAQERGDMPRDEPFAYFGFIEENEEGSVDYPFFLSFPARKAIAAAWRAGIAARGIPEVVSQWDWEIEGRYSTAYAILPLADDSFVIGRARCRLFFRTPRKPVDVRELAGELAIVDLAERLDGISRGEILPATREQLVALRAETDGWLREGALLDDVPPLHYS